MSVHACAVATVDGGSKPLRDHAGDVLLIVNVAGKRGLTPQYAGLEAPHREFGRRRPRVLGFPYDQFGGQEPGTDEEIQDFCSLTHDVAFPLFAKVDVNGPDATPLYHHLRAPAQGDSAPATSCTSTS
ncbi:glutathione peroxidase [Streptomyces fagopyri]|uniref:glutathione peroxidase n=1 Tax=Streptomyces fagopyri TaxID=2662397 RepID=UPI0033CFC0B1